MRIAIGILVTMFGLIWLSAEIWLLRTQPRRAVANAVLDSILSLLYDWPLPGIVLSIAVVVSGVCIAWTGGGG